jgi:hypothetical protein
MERNIYFENYINNLQKDIFLVAYDSNYEILSFISSYMKSNVRKEMDKPFSSWHNQNSNRIFEEVISENKSLKKVKKQTVYKDAVEWLGFFYSKWHFLTGESSKSIIKFLKPINGLKDYYSLHQLDEMEAIEKCKRLYNLSRNNHRRNENKKSFSFKAHYDDPIYYSYLAVRMLYKLKKNKILTELKYTGDIDNYDFIDDKYIYGIKSDVIFDKDKSELIKKYEQSDKDSLKFIRIADNSIYFCFVFSSIYDADSNDDEKLLNDIKGLKSIFSLSKRRYKYVYFYMSGKIYELTPSNELYVYEMPFSLRENAGILNKMEDSDI